MRKIPKLTVYEGSDIFTKGNKIRVGRKLLSLLTEREMIGAIAHEVDHAVSSSKRIVILVLLLIRTLVAIAIVESISYVALISRFPTLLSYLSIIIFVLIVWISFLLCVVGLLRRSNRRCEFEADKFAASFVDNRTLGEGMREMDRIRMKSRLRSRQRERLFPRPTLDERLKAIQDVRRLRRPSK